MGDPPRQVEVVLLGPDTPVEKISALASALVSDGAYFLYKGVRTKVRTKEDYFYLARRIARV